MERTDRRKGGMALAAAALGISASAVLHKVALGAGMHPFALIALRLGIALFIMLPMCKRQGAFPAIRRANRRNKGLLALSGVMLALHFTTWTFALQYGDALVATAIWSTFSLLTALGSALFLKERTPLSALLGMGLAVCGVGVCALGADQTQLLGVVMALGAAVFQAAYTLCGRAVRKDMDMLPYTMGVYAVAFLCTFPLALTLRGAGRISPMGLFMGLLLALICTLGGHSMQSYALKFFKAPTVSAAIMTEVVTGPLLVLAILGEAPRAQSLLGGLIILVGVGWVMIKEMQEARGMGASSPAEKGLTP